MSDEFVQGWRMCSSIMQGFTKDLQRKILQLQKLVDLYDRKLEEMESQWKHLKELEEIVRFEVFKSGVSYGMRQYESGKTTDFADSTLRNAYNDRDEFETIH